MPSGSGPESSQFVPGREPADQLSVIMVGDGGERGREPALEEHELLVHRRQHPVVHQQLAHERGGAPIGELAQRLVRDGYRAAGQASEQRGDLRVGEPRQRAGGMVGGQHSLHQRHQFCPDSSGAVVEKRGELVGQGAARAEPALEQVALDAAPGAGEVSGDARAIPADRRSVCPTPREQALGVAVWAATPGADRPCVARAADRSFPVRGGFD
ncbi:MAG: hypothetical protein ACRDRE_04965 [Pseudonocardiaceae bacterium]